MSVHDVTTGSIHLNAISNTFYMISEEIRAEFFDYPRYREQARHANNVRRLFQAICGEFQAEAFLEAQDLLEQVTQHPFFYADGLLRMEFQGFMNALDEVRKALRKDQEPLLVWSYLGAAYAALTHAVPFHYQTYPKYGSN